MWDGFAGEPAWCRKGDELFCRYDEGWMASKASPAGSVGPPRLVFPPDFLDTPGRSYDVSPDGQRLFVVQPDKPFIRNRIHLVTNFDEELERLLPVD